MKHEDFTKLQLTIVTGIPGSTVCCIYSCNADIFAESFSDNKQHDDALLLAFTMDEKSSALACEINASALCNFDVCVTTIVWWPIAAQTKTNEEQSMCE